MYEAFPTDGKYLINRKVYDEDLDYVVYELTCCQSCASTQDILGVYETWEYENFLSKGYYSPIESFCINPWASGRADRTRTAERRTANSARTWARV